MRTNLEKNKWKNVWIAGFSNLTKTNLDKNYLVFLMQVSEAYNYQKEIWENLPKNIRNIKNSRTNLFGDLYEPKPDNFDGDNFNPNNYYKPIKFHSHFKKNQWHNDINYENKNVKRKPSLLIGNPKFSFIWSKPLIKYKDKHPRNNKKFIGLDEFIIKLFV